MKAIALVNIPESPCPSTHNAACNEALRGFAEYGFQVSEVNRVEECVGKTILLLSDHRVSKGILDKLNNINPDAVYILWNYYPHLSIIPFKKYILTGEHYLHCPRLETHVPVYYNYALRDDFVSLLLRADESPSTVGTDEPSERNINGIFMGSGYRSDWIQGLPNIVYHDINRGGLIPYSTRKAYHLKSVIAFGFHSDSNIMNHHVTQRVFEGLAYGCVVISDNPAAAEITSGIVEYAATRNEFLEKYNYFLSRPDACSEKRKAGYEWCKKFGTNRYTAVRFLDKIRILYGINYAE